MFEWIRHRHASQELEHAKHRQEARDAAKHPDPLDEKESLHDRDLVVEEVAPEEFQRALAQKHRRRTDR